MIGCEACYLSEEAQFPSTHGARSPANTAARNRKVGAHRAREPVTNATAVKPSVDSTKLWLWRKQTRLHKSRPPVTSHVNHYSSRMKAVTQFQMKSFDWLIVWLLWRLFAPPLAVCEG